MTTTYLDITDPDNVPEIQAQMMADRKLLRRMADRWDAWAEQSGEATPLTIRQTLEALAVQIGRESTALEGDN